MGSKPYSGPGSSQAKNAGAIYCVFIPQAMVFSKDATGGKCPGNTHPYETVGETPPDDMLWCSFMVPPEMPPMPVAPNLPIGKPMAGPLATGAARDKKPAQ